MLGEGFTLCSSLALADAFTLVKNLILRTTDDLSLGCVVVIAHFRFEQVLDKGIRISSDWLKRGEML